MLGNIDALRGGGQCSTVRPRTSSAQARRGPRRLREPAERRSGSRPAIDVRSVPEGLHRNTQFDLAPFLVDRAADRGGPGGAGRGGAADRPEARRSPPRRRPVRRPLPRHRRLRHPPGQDRRHGQALLRLRPRIPSSSRSPRDVGLHHDARSGCPIFGVPGPAAGRRTRPACCCSAPRSTSSRRRRALMSLALVAARPRGGADRRQGQAALDRRAAAPRCRSSSTASACRSSLAARTRICVFFASPAASYRVQSLVANLAVRGAALVDGTRSRAYAGRSDGFVVGPVDLTTLGELPAGRDPAQPRGDLRAGARLQARPALRARAGCCGSSARRTAAPPAPSRWRGAGARRLHADQRHRPRARAALPRWSRRSSRPGCARSSPPSRAACG